MELIGCGSYGEVYKYKGKAIKRFKTTRDIIQEVCGGKVLRKSFHFLKFESYDIDRKEIVYPLYDCDLSVWRKEKRSEKDILTVLKQVVIALVELHNKKLVYCDLKPRNILINKETMDVVVGDLGLVCFRPYSSPEKCTEFYSESNTKRCTEHDIYSLGIIFLVFLSYKKFERIPPSSGSKDYKPDYDVLLDACSGIRKIKLASVVRRMLNPKKSERPTAREILYELWGCVYPICPGYRRRFEVPFSFEKLSVIHVIFHAETEKYKIYRKTKFLQGLQYYLLRYDIDMELYQLYIRASVFIMSFLFSEHSPNDLRTYEYVKGDNGKFLIDVYKNYIRRDLPIVNEYIVYIKDLMSSDNFVTIIMMN